MSRYVRIVLILALVLITLPVLPVSAADTTLPAGCQWVSLQHGAIGFVCVPLGAWGGDLVIFAHGYVAPGGQPSIPWDQLGLGGLPGSVTSNGYAFAVTSYRTNGLAIKDGVADLVELRKAFINYIAKLQPRNPGYKPPHTYVIGVSEGGLVTTLAIEQRPDIFSGGLACCGPIGDFREQIDYWGNFRVVYDFFFSDILPLPGSAMAIPPELMTNWEGYTGYKSQVLFALSNPVNLAAVMQLMSVTGAPYVSVVPDTIGYAVSGLLWYSVFATNDGIAKLGGIPFDNINTQYSGLMGPYTDLNTYVVRFPASQRAIAAINTHYQTTGRLKAPLVTIHNTGDPVVPYWHEEIYQRKISAKGSDVYYSHIIAIESYGHCNFTVDELLSAFTRLVFKVEHEVWLPR